MRTPWQDTADSPRNQMKKALDVLTAKALQIGREPACAFAFSRALTTASAVLYPSGTTAAGTQYVMPFAGCVIATASWDGAHAEIDLTNRDFAAGARLSVYAQSGTTYFKVKTRINGASFNNMPQQAINTNYLVIVLVRLNKPIG